MAIAIISHPDCMLHDPGLGHPERPDRVKAIQKALEAYDFKVPTTFHQAPKATFEQLSAVHDPHYLHQLEEAATNVGGTIIPFDEDTFFTRFTYEAALRAAGAVVFAVDMIMQKKAQIVFCNVRPPGHHAERGKAMGFCFLNNVAVGVAYSLKTYGLSRVAIIDFDVHHGNGTQDIFQNEERVLYCSSFQHPFYPGYDAKKNNLHLLNIPLPAGTSSAIFRKEVEAHWLKQIQRFAPELIFFSAGFDGHQADPLAQLELTADDYIWLTENIAAIARKSCGGKIISVLEGGYDLEVLATCVPGHVKACLK